MFKRCRYSTVLCKILITSRLYSTERIRVRFAPSPTGNLHLGGLRTALYNYLFARQHGGKFLLRIEDTDRTRLVPGASEALQEDLNWAGIDIDEGPNIGGHYGPYVQSERLPIYRDQVNVLLENGSAYRCFCTDRRLNLLRREAIRTRQIPKYDNRCRHLTSEEINKRLSRVEKHCIRFKLTHDCETFEDMIYGNIVYDVALNEGDPVIMKTDCYPTYHFANVVDDHFMDVTHVLRGVEWQISTTKHILMYRAFNWEPPRYGHLPLLMNSDGTKLSKRQGDIQISSYRDNGILPLTLVNFITNSGGGFQKDLERKVKPKIYTIKELTEQFDVENINSHSGRLIPERLLEYNRLELERQLKDELSQEKLVNCVRDMIKKQLSNRISRLSDLLTNEMMFVWVVPDVSEVLVQERDVALVEMLCKDLNDVEIEKKSLNAYLKDAAVKHNVSFKLLMKLLRTILSGLEEGPSVAEMIEILGKDNTVVRLELFLKKQTL